MKQSICKHCNTEFDISEKPKGWMANHSRWCTLNPKRPDYVVDNRKAINAMQLAKQESGKTNQYSKARVEGNDIPLSYLAGNTIWTGRKHNESTKAVMREKALASPHRRLRRKMIEYNGIWLDSTWELALAKRLDDLSIAWIRPDPIPWVDFSGSRHNYFADFYLPKYNLFLDPKNPRAILAQEEKLKCILAQYDNIIIIDSLDKCENYAPI